MTRQAGARPRKPLRRQFYHEAGHALAVGFRVLDVRLSHHGLAGPPMPGCWVGGGVTVAWTEPPPDGHAERASMVLLAGPAAQRLQSGEAWGWDPDTDAYEDMREATAMVGARVDARRDDAWALVGSYRAALDALVDALVERGHLAEAIAIFDAAAPGERGRVLTRAP